MMTDPSTKMNETKTNPEEQVQSQLSNLQPGQTTQDEGDFVVTTSTATSNGSPDPQGEQEHEQENSSEPNRTHAGRAVDAISATGKWLAAYVPRMLRSTLQIGAPLAGGAFAIYCLYAAYTILGLLGTALAFPAVALTTVVGVVAIQMVGDGIGKLGAKQREEIGPIKVPEPISKAGQAIKKASPSNWIPQLQVIQGAKA